jgi:hypothetical protein
VAQAVQAGRATLGGEAGLRPDKGVVITLRELGPILKLGHSAALVEGGTEVVLEVDEFTLARAGQPPRHLRLHWRHGGPGVVKGVATLAQDLQAALAAALQPGTGGR